MTVLNKLLKSWLLAYIIAVVGQQILMRLFKMTDWTTLQQISHQLAQHYTLIFTVIFAYFLFDDALYMIVSMLVAIIQPVPSSLLIISFSIIIIYVCRQLTMQSHELLGLTLATTFIIILSMIILPLFHLNQSLLVVAYQWLLNLPTSIFKILLIIIVFACSTLLPNNINLIIEQINMSSDMIMLASASSTIFIISLSTMCLYMGAIKESIIQSLLIPAIQLINVIKQPIVLIIPILVTFTMSMTVYYIMPLDNSINAVFYGSSFITAFIDGAALNGGGLWAWTNVLTIYAILPMLLTWFMTYTADKFNLFKQVSMRITRQTFQ